MAKAIDTSKATQTVVFSDRAYSSRTLVMDDGRVFLVEKSRITTTDAALIEYLDQHPDFDRSTEN